MGIIGLQNLTERVFNDTRQTNQVYEFRSLKKLKFVVDGNQIPYVLCSISKSAIHGGNYDDYYNLARGFLEKLKPFIEIVIFDGSKEDPAKANERLKKRICKIANVEQSIFQKKLDKHSHLNELKVFPPLFTKMILFDILKELNINYKMAKGMADHAIACYSNGFNDTGQYFTVLSRDSYFNVYNLEHGYVSWNFVTDILTDIDNLNRKTQVPVYYLSNMLKFLGIDHLTWIYYCVISGDYDIGLYKNIAYLRSNSLAPKNHQSILEHLKRNQDNFRKDNYSLIRSTYEPRFQEKIDNLINTFLLSLNEYEFMNIEFADDFDRFISCLTDMKQVYLSCLIEDPDEHNCFYAVQSNQLLKLIYYLVSRKHTNLSKVTEYSRAKSPKNYSDCTSFSPITIEMIENNKIHDYLIKKSFNKSEASSDWLTLFNLSLSIWCKWLNDHKYTNQIELSSSVFIDAIMINLIIIGVIGNSPVLNEFYSEKKEVNFMGEISEAYKRIKSIHSEVDTYYKVDVKLIHRFNEFQAIYYTLGVLNKVLDSNLMFLNPNHFMNCSFLVNYLKHKSNRDLIDNIILKSNMLIKIKRKILMKFDSSTKEFLKSNDLLNLESEHAKTVKNQRIYFYNIKKSISLCDLTKYFSKFGRICIIKLVKDKKRQNGRYCGFFKFFKKDQFMRFLNEINKNFVIFTNNNGAKCKICFETINSTAISIKI